MGGNGFNTPAFIKNAGPAAEGVFVGTAWNKVEPATRRTRRSSKLMKARGIDPDQFCAQAYTGVLVIAEAIKQAGGRAAATTSRRGFAKVKDLADAARQVLVPRRTGTAATSRPCRS